MDHVLAPCMVQNNSEVQGVCFKCELLKHMSFVDTAGGSIHTLEPIVQRTDMAILVLDVLRPDITVETAKLIKMCDQKKIPMRVVLNKCDSLE